MLGAIFLLPLNVSRERQFFKLMVAMEKLLGLAVLGKAMIISTSKTKYY